VTTVGYGEIYPHTQTGRVIGAFVMFSGIGFVALVTAAAAQRFLATAAVVEAEESLILAELRELRAEVVSLRAAKAGDQ
jgi:voltage-gated potassium channel